MQASNPKKMGYVLGATLAGAGVGAGIGRGVGGIPGATTGALAGGFLSGFSAAIAALSDAKTPSERASHVASALWDVTAAFAGSAASLGTAVPLQSSLVSTVMAAIEANTGSKLSASQRALVRASFDGIAWSALSPGVGLQAAGVAILFNAIRAGINKAFVACGCKAPLQRIASPGYMMMAMDYAALAFAVGAGVKGGHGAHKALTGSPLVTTVMTAVDGTPSALTSGMSGGVGFACGMLGTGLAERKNGGLSFAPVPPFTLQGCRNTCISRVVSMARSGLVSVGPLWGPLMWAMRDGLTTPGGVLDTMGASDQVIEIAAAGMNALIIGTMANEWFTMIRRNEQGAPGDLMAPQLSMARSAGIETQTDRWTAEIDEALQERNSKRDGDFATTVLRDVSEAIGAMFMTGVAIDSTLNDGGFRMEDSAISQLLDTTVEQGLGAFGVGLVFQFIALRSVQVLARDDPQGRRASSSASALLGGGVASLVASTSRAGWGVLAPGAIGVGMEVMGERAWKEYKAHVAGGHSPYPALDGKSQLDTKQLKTDMEELERGGRGRKLDEGLLHFQYRKWSENVMDPIRGRPHRPRPSDLAAGPVEGGLGPGGTGTTRTRVRGSEGVALDRIHVAPDSEPGDTEDPTGEPEDEATRLFRTPVKELETKAGQGTDSVVPEHHELPPGNET